jgi:hypothetical protein
LLDNVKKYSAKSEKNKILEEKCSDEEEHLLRCDNTESKEHFECLETLTCEVEVIADVHVEDTSGEDIMAVSKP